MFSQHLDIFLILTLIVFGLKNILYLVLRGGGGGGNLIHHSVSCLFSAYKTKINPFKVDLYVTLILFGRRGNV